MGFLNSLTDLSLHNDGISKYEVGCNFESTSTFIFKGKVIP